MTAPMIGVFEAHLTMRGLSRSVGLDRATSGRTLARLVPDRSHADPGRRPWRQWESMT